MPLDLHITARSVEGSPQSGENSSSGFTYINLKFLEGMRYIITGLDASADAGTAEVSVWTYDPDPQNRTPLWDVVVKSGTIAKRFDPPLTSDFGLSGLMVKNEVYDDPSPPGGFRTTLNLQGRIEGGNINRAEILAAINFDWIDQPPPYTIWAPDDWPGAVRLS